MTDKVQKIKEWISKTQDGFMDSQSNFLYPEHEGAYSVLCELDAYIDSLQEEPVGKVWHDASEEPKPNMELICVGQYGNPLVLSSNSDSFKSRDISKWAYFNDLLNLSNVHITIKNSQEPVSNDVLDTVNKEVKKIWSEINTGHEYSIIDSYNQFYGICMEVAEMVQKEPVSEELEEELTSYMENSFTSVEEPDEFLTTVMQRDDLLAFARHFAKWQEKQDQSTIELAEDHAMLAGIIKGTEHTIGEVRSILNKMAYKNNGLDVNGDYCEQPYVELDDEFRKLLK